MAMFNSFLYVYQSVVHNRMMFLMGIPREHHPISFLGDHGIPNSKPQVGMFFFGIERIPHSCGCSGDCGDVFQPPLMARSSC